MAKAKKSKTKRQVRKLVELLGNRYNLLSIFPEDIANCLECPLEVVEDELAALCEEDIIEPVWELPCGMCGRFVSSYEAPELIHKWPMVGECSGCLSWTGTESLSQDDLVMTYHFIEDANKRMCDHFTRIPGENWLTPPEVANDEECEETLYF